MSHTALRRKAMRLAYPDRDTGGWDLWHPDPKVDRIYARLLKRNPMNSGTKLLVGIGAGLLGALAIYATFKKPTALPGSGGPQTISQKGLVNGELYDLRFADGAGLSEAQIIASLGRMGMQAEGLPIQISTGNANLWTTFARWSGATGVSPVWPPSFSSVQLFLASDPGVSVLSA